MTIKDWMEGAEKYDLEDLTNFINAIETLLGWNDFFTAYGKDVQVLKTILILERTSQHMAAEKGKT